MKNTKIVHKRQDGGVSITTLAIDLTQEEIQAHIKELEASNPDFVSSRVIADELLPSDRTFRNAWTDDNPTDTVDIDISKAHDLKKDQMRAIRKPLLEKLDVEFQRAIEEGNDEAKAEVVAKKQALRDVTSLELPTDVEELKGFTPECLK